MLASTPVSPSLTTHRWFVPTLAAAALSVLALLTGVQLTIYRASRGEPSTWSEALGTGAVEWFSWGLLLPLIIWVFERSTAWRWPARLATHAAASLGLGVAHQALVSIGQDVLMGIDGWARFRFLLSKTTDFEILVYFAIVGALVAL